MYVLKCMDSPIIHENVNSSDLQNEEARNELVSGPVTVFRLLFIRIHMYVHIDHMATPKRVLDPHFHVKYFQASDNLSSCDNYHTFKFNSTGNSVIFTL